METLTREAHRWYATSLLILSLAWLLTSCAATGEPFKHGEQVPGKSSLYIYREHAMTGAAFAWDVYLDSEKVTELRTGGYFYSTISPGPHIVLVKVLEGLSFNFSTEPDQTYYFRLGAATTFTEHVFVIERVSESQALNELHDMKLQPLIK
jgi:uncharacterized protein DUF2846